MICTKHDVAYTTTCWNCDAEKKKDAAKKKDGDKPQQVKTFSRP